MIINILGKVHMSTAGLIALIVIIAACVIIPLIFFFSPRVRGKLMSIEVKAKKYMMDETKDDIKAISSDLSEATEEAIKTTTRAVKKDLPKKIIFFVNIADKKLIKVLIFVTSAEKRYKLLNIIKNAGHFPAFFFFLKTIFSNFKRSFF